jgi:hypothetical protein
MDPLGRILSDLASLLLHIRCCICAVHFVAHALHLCFALTPSSLESLPLFELSNFVRLLRGAFLCCRAAPLLRSECDCLLLSRHMCILCVVAHCALVAAILALLLFLEAKISSAFFTEKS